MCNYLIVDFSVSICEITLNRSKSKILILLSVPLLANKNTSGWNCIEVTAPLCSLLKTCIIRPTRKSHIYEIQSKNKVILLIVQKLTA